MSGKKEERMKLLEAMDNHLRNNINDEEIVIGDWLANGLPDAYDEDILSFIATYSDNYIECLESFVRCCIADKEDEDD